MKYQLLFLDSPRIWGISARADLHFLRHLRLSKPARIEQFGELWIVALHWRKILSCFSYGFPVCMHTALLISSAPSICVLCPCKIVNSLRKGLVINVSLYLSQHLLVRCLPCAQGKLKG